MIIKNKYENELNDGCMILKEYFVYIIQVYAMNEAHVKSSSLRNFIAYPNGHDFGNSLLKGY